ncbi:hypothetical protein D5S17_09990 [Pseudonocardiaceae bacterium YIM PH 21723]|nr:hypothetical protein D5S17_09990 [Pseudonocardiaceae bacterium YIM PH 21723]
MVVAFLFVPYAAHGHVMPMLAVAAELARRGQDVRIMVGERHAGLARSAGVPVVRMSREHEVLVPAGWGPGAMRRRVGLRTRRIQAWRATRRDLLAEVGRDLPMVVADPMARWLPDEMPVIPFWTTHAPGSRLTGRCIVHTLPELQRHRPEAGADVVFCGPMTRRQRPVRADRPLLLVGVGTVFARKATFFRQIAESFADSRWSVVMATGQLGPGELGRMPENVLASPWIPQAGLLRRASALLTHAGMNSVLESLHAGVPMLVAPRSREQRITARRLVGLDLARQWDGCPLRAVERLLADESVRAAHARMAQRLSADSGVTAAAEALIRWAR